MSTNFIVNIDFGAFTECKTGDLIKKEETARLLARARQIINIEGNDTAFILDIVAELQSVWNLNDDDIMRGLNERTRHVMEPPVSKMVYRTSADSRIAIFCGKKLPSPSNYALTIPLFMWDTVLYTENSDGSRVRLNEWYVIRLSTSSLANNTRTLLHVVATRNWIEHDGKEDLDHNVDVLVESVHSLPVPAKASWNPQTSWKSAALLLTAWSVVIRVRQAIIKTMPDAAEMASPVIFECSKEAVSLK